VPVSPVINQHGMTTKAKAGYRLPVLYHASPLSPVPKTFRSALADPNWRAPMEEYGSLRANKTWDLVPRPPRANIVTGKWIFKHKFQADVPLSDTRRTGFSAILHSAQVLTSMRPSVRLSNQPPCAPCYPWHCLARGRFINWM
jgi:hypothetical protein